MAYYLKYRPQKLIDLDLKAARNSLIEILKGKETPHAFLFVGPKGTGKTSSARIVAKAVNCTKTKTEEPCNKCDICTQITDGRSLDLIEIDAASNRGIDDIRDLKSKIKLAPAQNQYKVYIIDEVHMLTVEAFNALLKTLEEPPAHAKFILCTTEPQKLPGTIVSRCTQINFQKANSEEIVRALKRVVKGEKISVKDDDLVLIAKKSTGSFRDAVKVLEQLAMTNKKVSHKRVQEMLQIGVGEVSVDDWLVMVYQRQMDKALDWLVKAEKQGAEIKSLGVEVVERLREVLLVRLGVIKGDDIKEMDEVDVLRQLTGRIHQAVRQIKGAVIDSLPLELMVVEWCEEGEKIEGNGFSNKESDESKQSEETPKQESKTATKKPTKLKTKAGKLSLKLVADKWQKVLEKMRPQNHSLEALLRATKPAGFDGKFLMLEVFYKFHKERLEAERYKRMVEQVVGEVMESPVSVRFYLGEKTQKVVTAQIKDDNISAKIDDDIIKTAEEVFGVEVN